MPPLLSPSGASFELPGLGDARATAHDLSGEIWPRPRANARAALPEPLGNALRAVDPDFHYIRLGDQEPDLEPELHAMPSDDALFLDRRRGQLRLDLPTPNNGQALVVLWHDPGTGALRWMKPIAADANLTTYEIPVAARGVFPPPAAGGDALDQVHRFDPGEVSAKVVPQGLIVLKVGRENAVFRDVEVGLFKRGYQLWHYTEASYKEMPKGVERPSLPDGFWDGGDRGLGVIHGAFDRVALAFGSGSRLRGALGDKALKGLTDRYGSRMFAFDHPTVTETPEQNVARLLEMLPAAPQPVTLDLLCHSRGGIVARVLAGRKSDLAAKNITLGKILYVGTPNEGVRLLDLTSDGETLFVAFLNLYLTVFSEMDSDDAILSFKLLNYVVAHFGDKLLDAAPGIRVMLPEADNDFLQALNAQTLPEQRHLAITANYEPPPQAALWLRALNAVMDAFHGAANDIVVPTAGVFGVDAPGRFHVPLDNTLSMSATTGVWHLSYFGNRDVQENIVAWLKA